MSPATTTIDLAAAVSSGLLVAAGERLGRRYLGGERLFSSVAGSLSIYGAGTAAGAREVIVAELGRRLREAATIRLPNRSPVED